MDEINNLAKKYHSFKYPIGSKSAEWFDIKSDFELEDEALMSLVFQKEFSKIDKDKAVRYRTNIEEFKRKIYAYNPLNGTEEKEKSMLLKKVDIGLEIYKLIIDN